MLFEHVSYTSVASATVRWCAHKPEVAYRKVLNEQKLLLRSVSEPPSAEVSLADPARGAALIHLTGKCYNSKSKSLYTTSHKILTAALGLLCELKNKYKLETHESFR